jgi:hypothetical protein
MFQQRLHVLILLLLGSSFIIGCGSKQVPTPSPLPPSGTWRTLLFSDEEGQSPIVTHHVWMGNEVVFLIVPDFKQAGWIGGSGGSSDKAYFNGEMYLPDGKTKISFQAETVEGKIESVTIEGKSYDLSKGRLFFVSSKEELDVKQLDQDTRSLTPQPRDSNEIEAFLRKVPEFQTFLPSAGETP